jgi:predicted cupin superfamily sugar epimerase
MQTFEHYIDQLNMQPHPEGGWYAEVYRSKLQMEFNIVGMEGDRSLSTAIYFLLPEGKFSAFHRIKSDELWHHYDGGILRIVVIHSDGQLEVLKLGKDFSQNCRPLHMVPAGSWFASYPEESAGFVLCGCTVSPGFDFKDFELAERAELIRQFPHHETLIKFLSLR